MAKICLPSMKIIQWTGQCIETSQPNRDSEKKASELNSSLINESRAVDVVVYETKLA